MTYLTRLAASVLAAFVPLTLTAAPAHAGPPWISIELPANPLHPSTRGALFLVHSFHHGTPQDARVACSAEGLVDGARRSLDLTVNETNRDGVRAVRGTVPAEGTWMIVCESRDGRATATALLDVDAAGDFARIRVPHRTVENGHWSVPTDVPARDIDAMLRERARLTRADAPVELAGIVALLALVPVAWVMRRARQEPPADAPGIGRAR